MQRTFRRLAALLMIMGWAVPLRAQGKATVTGTVVDDDQHPLQGALLQILGTDRIALTNEAGTYALDGVEPGVITVNASKDGYITRQITGLRVAADKPTTLNFRLGRRRSAGTVATSPSPVEGELVLSFQLIRPIATRTTDKALAGVDSALRSLFQWQGYQLLSDAMITSDPPGQAPLQTSQFLDAGGERYVLNVQIESADREKVRLAVSLAGESRQRSTGNAATGIPTGLSQIAPLLHTTVTVLYGHTVILGTTHTGAAAAPGSGDGTLILTVKPRVQSQ
jgi:Carboxypeptidase regulatory-like domain